MTKKIPDKDQKDWEDFLSSDERLPNKDFKKSKLSQKDRHALEILGLKSEAKWEDIQKKFKENSISLLGIYIATDHPDKATNRRKPGVGMFLEASKDHYIDLKKSDFE